MMNNYVNEINEILYNYDVECLADYCGNDEYNIEAKAIAKEVNKDMTVEQVATICKDVFNEMFVPNHTIAEFLNIAEEILNLYN